MNWRTLNALEQANAPPAEAGTPNLSLLHGSIYVDTQLERALKRNGKEFQLFIKEDEGHRFVRPENRREFYAEVEKFLARHMAPK